MDNLALFLDETKNCAIVLLIMLGYNTIILSIGGKSMTIPVELSAEVFRRFTIFDILRRRKLWRSPVIFATILGISAIVCFLMHHVDGAVILGCVLLAVGLGMPVIWFTSFFLSLRKQILQQGLVRPQLVYTITLTPKKIGAQNEKEQVQYDWKDVHHAYRDLLATYLYITPERAFLLPHTCVENSDELWNLLKKKLPEEKRTVLI